MAGEKTEKATPKKRRDERKKGHVLMSKDAIAVATLFASIFMLRLLFPGFIQQFRDFFDECFSMADAVPTGEAELRGHELLIQAIALIGKTAGPLLAVTSLTAITATFAQTRLLVSGELLRPKFDRISPLQGFKRLFSLNSIIEAVKGILKITVLLTLIYLCLQDMLRISSNFLYADISGACVYLLNAIYSMMLKVGVAFLALAALDFLYQWWDFERQMKMSKQEIKEEFKQMEGDPQIKGKIKEQQRKMSQARMMQQVPNADVVVRNPTHFAVALRYHHQEDNAPVVLAKGQDELALRIVKVAEEHNVAVIENVPLARALYAQVEIDHEIPPELYGAVAEVMVYLYKLDNKLDKERPSS